jgi:hypothetical protein
MRLRSEGIVVLAVTLLMTLVSAPAFAQQASVLGTVTDATKAVLPGVSVTATNLATGIQTTSVSDERGEYRVVNLAPGRYKVQAELIGFSTVIVPVIELLVGQNATVPFALTLAQVNETVTVTGEAPFVDTASSQVSGNVNPRQTEQMPLQGRNWLELAKLVKGITSNEIGNNPGVAEDLFQLNLDGQQVTQKIAGSSFGQPRFSRDSIAEFQIVTNMFEITQGRSAGLQVQAISRSGTNNLAGSLYGYFRNDKLNSADAITGTVLPFRTNRLAARSAVRSSRTSCITSARTSTSASRVRSSRIRRRCRARASRPRTRTRRRACWGVSIIRCRARTASADGRRGGIGPTRSSVRTIHRRARTRPNRPTTFWVRGRAC